MKKKKICFIAQFPPPIHGLSKAVDTLYNSNLSNKFDLEKINITNNKKFLYNFMKLWNSNADLYYFTISQSAGGNIRDLIILQLLKFKKKKCLIHLHGGYFRKLVDNDLCRWHRNINYRVIRNLVGTIVLSPSLKSIFHGMIDEKRIFVVPNCVDDEFLISEIEFKDKIEGLEHKEVYNVLYLSNFIRSKGFPEVLEMAKLERERVTGGAPKEFHFNFAGKFFEDTEREYFESYIKENNLQDFITYHGIVNGQHKRELLKKCDIFMLLTNYPIEGQPISILEAMGNGLVIVTTNHAGIPDIVKDGENGIVVSKGVDDSMEIYRKLNLIKYKFKEIGQTNRSLCHLKFRESRYISSIEKLFEEGSSYE